MTDMRTARWRRWRHFSALTATLLLLAQVPGNAADGPWPGLPYHADQGGIWGGAAQIGMAETARAKQWVRVPFQTSAAWIIVTGTNHPPSNPIANTVSNKNLIYLVAPSGSDHNYGLAAPFTVRTVAFGAVPVTATVQLVQRRGANRLPMPLLLTQTSYSHREIPPGRPSDYEHTDTKVDGELSVRVTALSVDGINLNLRGTCQTATPGDLTLTGKGYWRDTPGIDNDRPWLSGNYVPAKGGLLTGTVDVPRFSGCTTTAGDDVSRVLTATVSGPDNQVELNVSAPICATLLPGPIVVPPAPGATSPGAANCDLNNLPPELPYPARTP